MKKSAETAVTKKLRLQLGVCKRMVKEVASYEKEVDTNTAKLQKMRDEGKDEYDIRKFEEVLHESQMMVPDSKTRQERTFEDLKNLLDDCAKDSELDSTILNEAEALLRENTV